MNRYIQRIAISLGVLLVVLALWKDYEKKHFIPPEPKVEFSSAIESEFQLLDQDGRPLSNRDMFGKYQLVYFGFTHCPDICPLGLEKIGKVLKDLSTDNRAVEPLFITLDPTRDTPEVMKEYLANFSPRIRGLTGDVQAIDRVAKNFKIAYEKHTGETEGDYSVTHSGYMFLMDKNGRNSAIFSQDDSAEKIVSEIRKQMRQGQ